MKIFALKLRTPLHTIFSEMVTELPYSLMKTTCEDIQQDLSILRDLYDNQYTSRRYGDMLPYFRDNYRLMRYEDLASEPEEWTRAMYKFIGVPMKPQVLWWIEQNTKQDDKEPVREK